MTLRGADLLKSDDPLPSIVLNATLERELVLAEPWGRYAAGTRIRLLERAGDGLARVLLPDSLIPALIDDRGIRTDEAHSDEWTTEPGSSSATTRRSVAGSRLRSTAAGARASLSRQRKRATAASGSTSPAPARSTRSSGLSAPGCEPTSKRRGRGTNATVIAAFMRGDPIRRADYARLKSRIETAAGGPVRVELNEQTDSVRRAF